MPRVWIVKAVIPRRSNRNRIDVSNPVTYTNARLEIERLEHLGIKAWMEEADVRTQDRDMEHLGRTSHLAEQTQANVGGAESAQEALLGEGEQLRHDLDGGHSRLQLDFWKDRGVV
jgi:hypothetical protein